MPLNKEMKWNENKDNQIIIYEIRNFANQIY